MKKALEKWNNIVMTSFPSASSWKTSACLIEVGTESFLDSLVSAHLSAVCSAGSMEIAPALKHTLQSLIQLTAELLTYVRHVGLTLALRIVYIKIHVCSSSLKGLSSNTRNQADGDCRCALSLSSS